MTTAPTSRPRTPRRARRGGFTLVELMVALAAGSFAIAGAYYLTSTSSRLFNEQMSLTEVSSSLRLAMEQIKRDVGRAGFLAARSRRELFDCGGNADSNETSPVAPIDAFGVTINSRTPKLTELLNVGQNALLRSDELLLHGNYASSDAYLIDPSYSTADNVLALQTGHDSFVRSFTQYTNDTTAPAFSQARFDAVFNTDRLVRIEHMQSGRLFFRRILSTGLLAGNIPTVTLDAPLPTLCFTPSEVAISPVVRVRYRLEAPTDDREELGLGYEDSDPSRASARRAVLVRRELSTNGAGTTPVPGTARVVLDYAVEFQVNAWYDANTPADGTPQDPATQPPLLTYASSLTSPTVQEVSTTAGHRFRSAVITLAARAPEADDRLPCVVRASLAEPLNTFRVADTSYERCARVRSVKSEIYMPNLAFRAGSM